MKQFIVQFTNNIELTYSLCNEEIVNDWIKFISNHNIEDCCPNNHYIGYATSEFVQKKIDRLYYLADLINQHVPDRVIKQNITHSSWKQELHKMHVHFPDLKNNNSYKNIWNELSEYNDIIHWLESTMDSTIKGDSSKFRITLDFNKSNTLFKEIPHSAYKLFNPYTNFGYLLLHYTHVGKHAQELFTVNDMTCPNEQFVPQRTFSASVRMYFTNNFFDTDEKRAGYLNRWAHFYTKRGVNFWKYKITDPLLAFGYIKIGDLINICVDNIDTPIPVSIVELNNFRELLVKSKILRWEIKGA